MTMADDEEDGVNVVVTLADAEGNERAFVILGVIEVDEEEYALLTPADAEEDAESTEIFIFHYWQDEDGMEVFTELQDKETFDKVRAEAGAHFALLEEGE